MTEIDKIRAETEAATEGGLLPCPFCEGEAEICRVFGRIGVACKECNVNIRSEIICSETGYDGIIAAWNKRTPSVPRLCDALELAIEEIKACKHWFEKNDSYGHVGACDEALARIDKILKEGK